MLTDSKERTVRIYTAVDIYELHLESLNELA